MGRIHILVVSTSLLAATLPALAMPRPHRGPTSPNLFAKRSQKANAKILTQRAIAPERATQIQSALIKSGYMTGSPSGSWDAATEAAMQKYQSDNGWQTKLTPDSRAIIKLGLGPKADSTAAVTPKSEASLPSNSAPALPTDR